MNWRPKGCPGCAFALIELLVAIAIIGILASLLNTGLGKFKTSAQATLCKNNLQQVGGALEMFVSEHQWFPVNHNQLPAGAVKIERTWMGQLARDRSAIAVPTPGFHHEGVWRCPSAKWTHAVVNSGMPQFSDFGYNDDKFLGAGPADETNKFGLQGHYLRETGSYAPIAESEVLMPSEMMAIAGQFRRERDTDAQAD